MKSLSKLDENGRAIVPTRMLTDDRQSLWLQCPSCRGVKIYDDEDMVKIMMK